MVWLQVRRYISCTCVFSWLLPRNLPATSIMVPAATCQEKQQLKASHSIYLQPRTLISLYRNIRTIILSHKTIFLVIWTINKCNNKKDYSLKYQTNNKFITCLQSVVLLLLRILTFINSVCLNELHKKRFENNDKGYNNKIKPENNTKIGPFQ